jgi:CBS domain-containing protein
MLMLSELNKYKVVDEKGGKAPLADLAIELLADTDYPPVTSLFYYTPDRQTAAIKWQDIRDVNLTRKQILVSDLNNAKIPADDLSKEILLKRDIQDSIILDLQNRRATRANDLWLDSVEKKLVLRGADVGMRAILRRISGGRFAKPRENQMYDWRYIEFLRGNAGAVKNGAGYHLRVTRLSPGEIAGLIDAIPYLHAAELIVLLPDELASSVLEVVVPEKQLQILEELDEAQALKLVSFLAPESVANIARRLVPERTKKLLESLPKLQSQKVIELLRYPEGTVGSIMTNEVVFAPSELTVADFRNSLFERLNIPNFVYFIYTVTDDESRRLNGVLSLRRLVTAKPEEKLSDVADSYVSFLHPLEPASTAAFRVIDSHLAAMPVVNEEGKLIGALTIDAAVSVVAPRAWRDLAPRIFS